MFFKIHTALILLLAGDMQIVINVKISKRGLHIVGGKQCALVDRVHLVDVGLIVEK